MDVTRPVAEDRFYSIATKVLVALLVVAVLGFAVYYYFDRYHANNVSPVDQEVARMKQMINDDPSSVQDRLTLAGLYLTKEVYPQAITQYQEALKLDDKNVSALIGMGIAYYKSGKSKEAAASFEQVLTLTKGDDAAQHTPIMAALHYYLGLIYADQGKLQPAEGELRLALTANTTDADTIKALADVVAKEGRNQDAIGLYNNAVALVPNFTGAYAGLAKAYAAVGKTTDAEYANAMVAYSQGSYDDAIAHLKKVLQAKPDFAAAYFGLGASYDKKNDKQNAIDAYQQALRLDPNNEAARVSIERLGVKLPPLPTPTASANN